MMHPYIAEEYEKHAVYVRPYTACFFGDSLS